MPIVILTTSSENSDIKRAYEFGVNAYIVKPVDFDAFVEVVKNIKMDWLLSNDPPLIALRKD